MYTRFYGLNKKPFEITPDPRFLYASEQHKEVFANMLYGIREKKGLIVLTGEVGTGKTLLIRTLLRKLDPTTRSAYIFNPRLNVGDFFRILASEFGLESALGSKGQFLEKLNAFLLGTVACRSRAVLIVDEAQSLSLPLLEEIRMLMNLETSREKLLQVILAGQPEFHKLIELDSMKQFKQRISLRCHLRPLSSDETNAYIQRRLHVAGHNGRPIFTEKAIRKIHKYSKGIPRLINVVCDNALLIGYAVEKDQIDVPVVHEVIEDLEGKMVFSKKRETRRGVEAKPRPGDISPKTAASAQWTRPASGARPKKHGSRLGWALAGVLLLTAVIAAILLFPDRIPGIRQLRNFVPFW